jgi:hypothetical protein
MTRRKIIASVLFLTSLVFILITPRGIIAGGLQEKIQQKIGSKQNIQYNLMDESQGESSYIQQSDYKEQRTGRQDIEGSSSPRSNINEVSVSRTPAPAESRVISSYAIYRSNYKAEIEEDVVTVNGSVLFEVFRKGWTQIPLVRSNVGLIDVSVNRGASFVTMQGNRYFLMVDKPGRYTLDIEFLLKASRERENGPGNFNLELIPAPISQFEFTMPEEEVDIFVDPSIKVEVKKEPKKTVAWAVMPNTERITVRWTKALPKETITPVKLEPKVYADTSTYASIGEGLIRCQSSINYSILQSEVPSFRLAFPEDVGILEVRGRDLRDWKVSKEAGVQYLEVYLNFGVKGNYTLNIIFERNVGTGSIVAQIPTVRIMGAERETGYFGIAAATNVELAVNKVENATSIDVKELPSTIWGSGASPILLAFKYLNHPFSIAIDVTKHEELPVLVAAIDSADYVSLDTKEGKSLTKAVYQVRNNVKQFIHLVLPKSATLWSALVSGKPVKPAKDKTGSILIPLEKSQLQGETLTQFPVEIVYLDKTAKMGMLGSLRLNLPQTDIPTSSLNWSVYLPLDYLYFNFGGDVQQAKERGDLMGLFGVQTRQVQMMDKVSREEMRQQEKNYIGEQFAAPTQIFYKELESAQMKGALPIKIDIPQRGRIYRFNKLLVTEKESPWLSVTFAYAFRQLYGFFWLAVIILSVFVVAKKIFKKRTAVG